MHTKRPLVLCTTTSLHNEAHIKDIKSTKMHFNSAPPVAQRIKLAAEGHQVDPV